jgi:hypothetical protein
MGELLGRPRGHALALGATLLLVAYPPVAVQGQERSGSVFLQAGLAGGSPNFTGLGASATVELGVGGSWRPFVRWTDWEAFASCTVDDAPTFCRGGSTLWEAGFHRGVGVGQRVAPFLGGGLGLFHSGSRALPLFSLSAGLDIVLADPVGVRLSAVHQEIRNNDQREWLGGWVRYTGLLVGLGVRW